MTSQSSALPPGVRSFVAAAERLDLAALHAAIDWEATGRRRVHEAAAGLAGEVEPEVVDDAVRRGMDESRRASHDVDLVTPYLASLLDRLGPIHDARPAAPDELDRLGSETLDDPQAAVYVVAGDHHLLLTCTPQAPHVIILGWLDEVY